jgi:glycosyltransferase involved in cell wall biosynthesis
MNKGKILFVSRGAHAASTRYRALAYFDVLRQNGWQPAHLSIHGTLSRLRLLPIASRADVTVILRKTFSIPYLYLLGLCSKHLILDLDDAIFCRSNGSTSPTRQKRFAKVARRCRQIWAGNSYLANVSRRYNPSVLVLPTSLELEKYSIEATKPSDTLDLVWIGSSSTRRYLTLAIPVLENLAELFSSLRLKIVADFNLPNHRLRTEAIQWSEKGEAQALASAHIGIAPMPDNSWTRGKCGLKVLQYMAAGLPVVSSPVGVNRDIVDHGTTGFHAASQDDWFTAVEKLIRNPELRQSMGEAGRRRVSQSFSITTTYEKIEKNLQSLLRAYDPTSDGSRPDNNC